MPAACSAAPRCSTRRRTRCRPVADGGPHCAVISNGPASAGVTRPSGQTTSIVAPMWPRFHKGRRARQEPTISGLNVTASGARPGVRPGTVPIPTDTAGRDAPHANEADGLTGRHYRHGLRHHDDHDRLRGRLRPGPLSPLGVALAGALLGLVDALVDLAGV